MLSDFILIVTYALKIVEYSPVLFYSFLIQSNLGRFFRVSGKHNRETVFDHGVYVGKNSSQAANVELVHHR